MTQVDKLLLRSVLQLFEGGREQELTMALRWSARGGADLQRFEGQLGRKET